MRTVGVEEELLLVDAASYRPRAVAGPILATVEPGDAPADGAIEATACGRFARHRRTDGRGDDLFRRAAIAELSDRRGPGGRRVPPGRRQRADRRAGPGARGDRGGRVARRPAWCGHRLGPDQDGDLAGEPVRARRLAAGSGRRASAPGLGGRRGLVSRVEPASWSPAISHWSTASLERLRSEGTGAAVQRSWSTPSRPKPTSPPCSARSSTERSPADHVRPTGRRPGASRPYDETGHSSSTAVGSLACAGRFGTFASPRAGSARTPDGNETG